MKTRNGFVSNSSSSSFIVGIGKVNNLGKLRAYFDSKGIKEGHDVRISKVSELNKVYGVTSNDSMIRVNSFATDVTLRNAGVGPSDDVVIVNISNDEGDGAFWNEDTEEMNYDIDLDDFDADQQATYNMFFDKNSGIDINTADATYGAARNG